MTTTSIKLKWNKLAFDIQHIESFESSDSLKKKIFEITSVPTSRQKLMCKRIWSGILKDQVDVRQLQWKSDDIITLLGSSDVVETPSITTVFVEDLTETEQVNYGAIKASSGLTNLGNTCFMNSVIQCLRHIPELRNLLNSAYLADSLIIKLLQQTFSQLDSCGSQIVPSSLVTAIRTNYPQYMQRSNSGGYLQHDAEEFFSLILSLFNELSTSVYDDIFGITIEETLTCNESYEEQSIIKTENLNKLASNIQGGIHGIESVDHLHEGLRLWLEGNIQKQSQILQRDALWNKRSRVAKLPKVLCIQFIRFFWKLTPDSLDHQGVKCKILRAVSFPETLDIYDFCTTELQEKLRLQRNPDSLNAGAQVNSQSIQFSKGLYQLHSIITHKGRSADSGHYMSWVRQEDESKWWKFDDDKVSEMFTEDVMKLVGGGDREMAYLLLYRVKL